MKNDPEIPAADMDGGWKEIIDDFTEDFFKFYFPDIHEAIDFPKGFKLLDNELRQIVSDGEGSEREVDKLIEVHLKDGDTKWLLIHVEVQSQRDREFEKRMYVYNYRIFDKYDRDVVSLAILADGDRNYHPRRYSFSKFGFTLTCEFPTVKLIDLDDESLEDDDNPFAIATLVQKRKIESEGDEEGRYVSKFTLTRELYRRRFDRDTIGKLYKFIDYVLQLPRNLAIKFKKAHEQLEEDLKMPYVTSNERLAKEEGLLESTQEDILDVLEVRFNEVPYAIKEKINYCDDLKKLKQLLRQAASIKSIDELDV